MSETKAALQNQVSTVVNDAAVPEYVKIMVQNYAGMLYLSQGLLTTTITSNQRGTLSPFAIKPAADED